MWSNFLLCFKIKNSQILFNFFYKLSIKSKTLLSIFLIFSLFNLSYYNFFFPFIANINNCFFYWKTPMLPFLKHENLFVFIIIFKIFILPPHQNFWLRRLRDFSSPERNNFGLGLLFIWGQTIERSLNWPWWVNVIHTHTRKGSLLKT